MARSQQVRAIDLHARGIVDMVVAERPDAADEAEAFCQRVGRVLEHELAVLLRVGPGSPADRARRYV
jgi:acetyl-CoA carboxylase carboxyl transferase subunit beta